MSDVDPVPDPELQIKGGERAVYRLQADDAKLAMAAAASDLKLHLKAVADPRVIVRKYPLAGLGVAAGAGLIAAVAFVPSKQKPVDERIERLERTLKAQAAQGMRPPMAKKKPSLLTRLVRLGFKFGKPMLIRFVISSLGGATGAKAAEAASDNIADAEPAADAVAPPPAGDGVYDETT